MGGMCREGATGVDGEQECDRPCVLHCLGMLEVETGTGDTQNDGTHTPKKRKRFVEPFGPTIPKQTPSGTYPSLHTDTKSPEVFEGIYVQYKEYPTSYVRTT